ncbi:GNAT family N-acetyltransferase [Nostoc sp.]|uniref:GNAT family N-acetyltransferase n=1 Tax=Nostoc sp. TaxID=1180 RepID=UPI002FF9B1EB
MPEYKISIEIQPGSKQVDFVDKQLHQFNIGNIGDYQYTPLFLLLRDSEENVVVGGLEGFIGYGKALLLAAEQEAVNRGCLNVYVFTYSFQAPEFYQHLGYQVFGELEDFPPGHRRYFLKKSL